MPRPLKITALVTSLLLLAACNFPFPDRPIGETGVPPVRSLVEDFPVDPLFQEFYDYLGGEEVLGPAISPAIPFGNIQSQYLESAQLLYDPLAPDSDRYSLAPLGVYLGISEEPVPDPGRPEVRYSNGHVIYEEFVPFYDQLGGARFVGRPLTEVRHNPDKQRIEQYFENLGLYHLESDPAGKVRLIAYGAFSCDQRCREPAMANSLPSPFAFLPEPFSKTASSLGLGFTGLTLSEPFRNQDGQMEVIFQNLVMVLEPATNQPESALKFSIRLLLPAVLFDNLKDVNTPAATLKDQLWVPLVIRIGPVSGSPSQESPPPMVESALGTFLVSFKPIVELLGIQPQPPVSEIDDPLLVFYPSGEGKGYHVPVYFNQYLQRFGGRLVAGDPITEVFPVGGGVFRQCFENLCLDFDPSAQESWRLRPVPLGAEYQARFFPESSKKGKSFTAGPVQLEVWEGQAYVSAHEAAIIHAQAKQADRPLEGKILSLTLTLPDNSTANFSLPPTDPKGETSFRLPVVDAPNGTLLPYRVCLDEPAGEQTCQDDHFLVWDFP